MRTSFAKLFPTFFQVASEQTATLPIAMTQEESSCPMKSTAVVDRYFLEHRAKLLDIAAFLDRVDRADSADSSGSDFRVEAMHQAIKELGSDAPGRTRRIHEIFSDQSTEPIDEAPMKGALGAFDPNQTD